MFCWLTMNCQKKLVQMGTNKQLQQTIAKTVRFVILNFIYLFHNKRPMYRKPFTFYLTNKRLIR